MGCVLHDLNQRGQQEEEQLYHKVFPSSRLYPACAITFDKMVILHDRTRSVGLISSPIDRECGLSTIHPPHASIHRRYDDDMFIIMFYITSI